MANEIPPVLSSFIFTSPLVIPGELWMVVSRIELAVWQAV